MRVVVAPDKFKGSLGAADVAARVAAGLRSVAPGTDVRQIPVADGGEGTLAAAEAAGFRRVPVRVTGPTGRPLDSALAVRDRTAVVEMAAASGLAVLPGGRRAPLEASSLGTGELVRAALDRGCTEVVLGIGGSACTDGGAGLLVGLGARLLDADGVPLPPGGGALARLARVELDGLDARLRGTRVVLATDVDNPLLGERGAAAVYGPQKGATAADVAVLEAGLRRWVDALGAVLGPVAAEAAERPGAGAAGGLGHACLAVLGAVRRPGIEVVLDLTTFADLLPGAVLVVTGEGSLDAQTLHGKAPAGVAAAARAAGVPVVAVAGRCLLDAAALRAAGIDAAYALTDLESDVGRCMQHAGPLLERLGARIARDRGLGAPDRPTLSGAAARGGPA
ncbi:glycerate kinase [Geodermatophilus sp. YIM 151500]|uniref:glycerate kinase n=1 Tax=Geodermatophilus sp. YIM 151500 TaxID=2984531 RepID=UPI0021E4532C|nr:glycerate kinase [Geodermatophilus sp. YIM 151500]MCV2487742.1 glycerate kinase [Geodermatophilus sp. YIM 151500]